MKPTHGVVNNEGAKRYSHTLDTIGWYGRSVADLRLVAEAFRLFGLEAPGASPAAPCIGLCRGPNWALASAESQAALLLAGERLQAAGIAVEEVTLPATFGEVTEDERQIAFGEGRGAFLGEYLNAHALLHQDFRDRVENSGGITAASLRAAYDHAAECRKLWDALFPPYDGILTVAAVGEAPVGRQDTGDHVFNAMWTLLHVPCIGMPCTRGPHGAPVGVQVIGPRFGDAALLDLAAVLAPVVAGG
jgi:Asp-tRNA(Asn)/Glu-tRNA(Gln) amidotransferase A subunit family amidase